MARLFARDGYALVLVARRGSVLEDLAAELSRDHGVAVRVMPIDLATPDAAMTLFASLQSAGVTVDVLVEGVPMARRGAPNFPSPRSLAASPGDPRIVALAPLFELKLYARRLQDLADVAELLKPLSDVAYTEVEAAIDPSLRAELYRLRREALDELAMEER